MIVTEQKIMRDRWSFLWGCRIDQYWDQKPEYAFVEPLIWSRLSINVLCKIHFAYSWIQINYIIRRSLQDITSRMIYLLLLFIWIKCSKRALNERCEKNICKRLREHSKMLKCVISSGPRCSLICVRKR